MKQPVAIPTNPVKTGDTPIRSPRAFAPATVEPAPADAPDPFAPPAEAVASLRRPRSWAVRALVWAGGVLVSLGLALAAERLIRDLFARYEWLGWLGVAALVLLVVALVVVIGREVLALGRLRTLDRLRERAGEALISDDLPTGRAIVTELIDIYAGRPDMARARASLERDHKAIFDGAEAIRLAERTLLAPLDERARRLIAASSRRVALVTTVSPRALVDIAFVLYESIRVGGAIAALYGARPGLFGFLRLAGAILAHLAVTGGLVLTDGVVEQLLGQGLAAKLSARLGEGVVNALMTVRVGISAIRVVRPLPFAALRQPMVKDFIPELVNVLDRHKPVEDR